MTESVPTPAVDLAAIRFPSDRWTVADLRRVWPESFDRCQLSADRTRGDIRPVMQLNHTLGVLVEAERVYADLVFRHALGLRRADGGRPQPDSAADLLHMGYVDAGLAAGAHEAEEMLRSIARQARAQAGRFHGRPR